MVTISSNQKKLLIVVLTVLISIWHYSTNVHHPVLHILHRELYLVPIVLAAYWFGKKGGLTASVISSLLFLFRLFIGQHTSSSYQLSNIMEVLTFNVVAYILGIYRDARRERYTTFWRPDAQTAEAQPVRRNILLVVDNSAIALKTARYVVDNFGRHPNMTVTILGIIREPSEDLFPNSVEYRKAIDESRETISTLVEDAQKMLLSGGFPQEVVSVRTIRIGKESIGSRLLKEQTNLQCDTIVVGGVRMSKAQEFIFGNLAVKLVRESRCPVVTVY